MDVFEVLPGRSVGQDSEVVRMPVGELLAAVYRRRTLLAAITGIGTLLFAVCVFFVPNEYTSVSQLMPPDSQTFATNPALSALTGMGLLGPAGLGSNLLNQRTPGAIAIGILSSSKVEDDIINRFDLRRVYHYKLYVDARKELQSRAAFSEDKKSGIITIAITDRDRYRARNMAQDYIDELNQLTNSLSTSAARRERIFLEQELASIKAELDASTQQLATFSSRNATFDLQKQGEATVEFVDRMQGQLIAAESELSALQAVYTDDNARVREARGRVAELQAELRKVSGYGEQASGAGNNPDQTPPALRRLPQLGVTYYDLYRKVTLQEALYETLSKQYELAKIEEAKEIPRFGVISPPGVPERKSSPHRLLITLAGFLVSFLAGVVWIAARRFWEISDNSHPFKRGMAEFLRCLHGEISSAEEERS